MGMIVNANMDITNIMAIARKNINIVTTNAHIILIPSLIESAMIISMIVNANMDITSIMAIARKKMIIVTTNAQVILIASLIESAMIILMIVNAKMDIISLIGIARKNMIDYKCPSNSYYKPNRKCYDTFDDCECEYGYYKSDE